VDKFLFAKLGFNKFGKKTKNKINLDFTALMAKS
jgi:hypothetical protein